MQVLVAVTRFMATGQVIVGASVSFTVTRKVQILVSPAPSVVLHVTVLIPFWKVEVLLAPLAVGVVPPLIHWGWPVDKLQLSDAAGVEYDTTALHWPASVLRTKLAGQAMVGAWPSVTVMVKAQVLVSPTPSVACQRTVDIPFVKVDPLVPPLICPAPPLEQLSE